MSNAARTVAVVAPVDLQASEFNDRVWSSDQLRDVGGCLGEAAGHLRDGKGWGLLALGMAKTELLAAVALIEVMEGWV